jgi:prepilin-type processing-associated H-X9-DG protein
VGFNGKYQPTDFLVDQISLTVNDGPNSISSDHPRGPAVLFCDGSVYRLNPSIDRDTLKAMLTINGGEDVSRTKLLKNGLLIEP